MIFDLKKGEHKHKYISSMILKTLTFKIIFYVKQYTRHGRTFQGNVSLDVSIIIMTLRQKSRGENKIRKHFGCISLFTPTFTHLLITFNGRRSYIYLLIFDLYSFISGVLCVTFFNICMYVSHIGFTTTYAISTYHQ